MRRIKFILRSLLYAVHGFVSGFFTPYILSLAFNFTHGVANNPDGVMFIPLGIANLLVILAIDILIFIKTIKSEHMTRIQKIVTISVFIIAKCIGLGVEQNGWKNFMQYFMIWLELLRN